MSTKVNIDGVIFDESTAVVSVFDRGFLYGDSVFEVIRTYEGVPFGEREHLERLARSCEKVLIPLPSSIDEISSEIKKTLAAATNEESYIRIIITRGTGPLNYDPSTARAPRRLIVVAPLQAPSNEVYERGVAVALVRASRPTDETRAAGAKASNYLASILAMHEAKQRGGYEAIILGSGGEVLEGASSNIFAIKNGKLLTPRGESGILEGITRAVVLEAAKRIELPCKQGVLFPADLYQADEVFITSTLREVVPVVRVDGHAIGTGQPGAITKRLHETYRQAVRERV